MRGELCTPLPHYGKHNANYPHTCKISHSTYLTSNIQWEFSQGCTFCVKSFNGVGSGNMWVLNVICIFAFYSWGNGWGRAEGQQGFYLEELTPSPLHHGYLYLRLATLCSLMYLRVWCSNVWPFQLRRGQGFCLEEFISLLPQVLPFKPHYTSVCFCECDATSNVFHT